MDLSLLVADFYSKAVIDNRIGATHISLYMALLHAMFCAGCCDQLLLQPDLIMRLSKISSRVTYHRCMKALHFYGYIIYSPSFRPGESKVRLIQLL